MFVAIVRLADEQIYQKLAPHIIDIAREYPDMRAALLFENAEKQTGPLVERFDVSKDKAEQFVQSICIAVTMQLNTFTNKRMKILDALSFMCGGIAQVWTDTREFANFQDSEDVHEDLISSLG